jgi:hypothetical protein
MKKEKARSHASERTTVTLTGLKTGRRVTDPIRPASRLPTGCRFFLLLVAFFPSVGFSP